MERCRIAILDAYNRKLKSGRLVLPSTLFYGGQNVLLLTDEKAPFLPRILQMERPEIVPQTALSRTDDSH